MLRRASGVASREAEVLTPLRAAHLIRSQGAPRLLLEPYHDRIRQALLGGITESRARAIHLALAEAMEQLPRPDVRTLSLHYAAAGLRERAGQCALQAARQAVAALAFGRAAELFGEVLRLKQLKGREYPGSSPGMGRRPGGRRAGPPGRPGLPQGPAHVPAFRLPCACSGGPRRSTSAAATSTRGRRPWRQCSSPWA